MILKNLNSTISYSHKKGVLIVVWFFRILLLLMIAWFIAPFMTQTDIGQEVFEFYLKFNYKYWIYLSIVSLLLLGVNFALYLKYPHESTEVYKKSTQDVDKKLHFPVFLLLVALILVISYYLFFVYES